MCDRGAAVMGYLYCSALSTFRAATRLAGMTAAPIPTMIATTTNATSKRPQLNPYPTALPPANPGPPRAHPPARATRQPRLPPGPSANTNVRTPASGVLLHKRVRALCADRRPARRTCLRRGLLSCSSARTAPTARPAIRSCGSGAVTGATYVQPGIRLGHTRARRGSPRVKLCLTSTARQKASSGPSRQPRCSGPQTIRSRPT